MTVTVGGIIIAEGAELECAMYTFALIEMLRKNSENIQREKAKKDVAELEKSLWDTYDEMIKKERKNRE